MKTKTIFMLISIMIFEGNAFSQQSISGMFNSNGIERGFTGAIPRNAVTPMRLVILFHGTGENGYEMEVRGFNEFLGNNTMVVYPIAFNRMAGFAGTDTIDDFQMVEDLIAHVETTYTIDTSDICIGGFSSGGAFTYNLVCDFNSPASTRDYRFKALAVVSGFADTGFTTNCSVASQVPLIAFHGTADQIAVYNGGTLRWIDSLPALPTESIVDFWATGINGCKPNPTLTILPDTATEQLFSNSYPERLEYDCPCTKNTKFYRIVQGTHSWPSGKAQNDFWQGTNMDISASSLIAEFFDFKRCDSTSTYTGLSNEERFADFRSSTVYPNPASNVLFIQGVETINNATIYSVNGEMLKSYTGHITQLNIAHLNPGLYFLRIESNKGVSTHKIIKQ